MNCPNCGAVNRDGSQWCGACGKALKRKKVVLIVFSVILLWDVPGNIFEVFSPFYLDFFPLVFIIRIITALYSILSLASAISALITATKNKPIISKRLGIALVIVASLGCIVRCVYFLEGQAYQAYFETLPYTEYEVVSFVAATELPQTIIQAIQQLVFSILYLVGIKQYNGKSITGV